MDESLLDLLLKMDTRHPPTWDGTTVVQAGEGLVDDASWLRTIKKEDKVNYKVAQRAEGDLFERDLINDRNLKKLLALFFARNGFHVNIPATAIAPSQAISSSELIVPSGLFSGWYIVSLGAKLIYGAESKAADCGVRVADRVVTEGVVGTMVLQCSAEDETLWTVENLGDAPTSTDGGVDVFLYNESDSDLVVSGWAVLLPKI